MSDITEIYSAEYDERTETLDISDAFDDNQSSSKPGYCPRPKPIENLGRPRNFMFESFKGKRKIPNNLVVSDTIPDGIRNIVRGDTPEHFLHLPYRKSDVDSLLITYKQGSHIVEKRLDDVRWDGNIAYYQFTQEETNKFDPIFNYPCNIQIRALLKNGDVITSRMYSVRVLDVLNDEELIK